MTCEKSTQCTIVMEPLQHPIILMQVTTKAPHIIYFSSKIYYNYLHECIVTYYYFCTMLNKIRNNFNCLKYTFFINGMMIIKTMCKLY